LLIIAATLSNHFERDRYAATLPLYIAVAFSGVGLLLTVKAAPIMLGLASAQTTTDLQRAFDEFFVWGLYLRGAVDTLAFVALVWALAGPTRRTSWPAHTSYYEAYWKE
jgi:hypothetical protein